MIDFSPNSTANIYLRLDDDGAPVLNATIYVTIVGPSGRTIVTDGSPTQVGGGVYAYALSSADTAEIGSYFVTWRVTLPTESESTAVFTVGYESAYTATLQELRHTISRLVEGTEGFLLGAIKGAPMVSLAPPYAKTITDYARMESDQAIRGWKFYCYGGPGQGTAGRITQSQAYSFTAVPTRPAATELADGSLYELHRHFDVDDLNTAIQGAILEVQDTVLVPISQSQTTLAYPTLEYPIPAGFSHLHAVDVEASSGQWVEIVPACWRVIRSVRRVQIDRNVAAQYSGCKLRLRGFRPPQVPALDDQGIDVRPSFVVYRAAAMACESKTLGRSSDPEGFGQKMQLFETRAEAERIRIARRLPPNTRRVD